MDAFQWPRSVGRAPAIESDRRKTDFGEGKPQRRTRKAPPLPVTDVIFAPMSLIEELKWRGLLHDIMPGTEELMEQERVKAYVGFDPTADSLHIGNLVPI